MHVPRAANFVARKAFVELVESVRSNNGVVRIFSTQHVSGERMRIRFYSANVFRNLPFHIGHMFPP